MEHPLYGRRGEDNGSFFEVGFRSYATMARLDPDGVPYNDVVLPVVGREKMAARGPEPSTPLRSSGLRIADAPGDIRLLTTRVQPGANTG